MPPELRTTDEELAQLVAQVKDDSWGAGSCYLAARNAFVAIHTVCSTAHDGDAHPAIIRCCALLLETLANDLAHEASRPDVEDPNGRLASLCERILSISAS